METDYPDGFSHLSEEQRDAYEMMEPLLLHRASEVTYGYSPLQPALTEIRLLNAWLEHIRRRAESGI